MSMENITRRTFLSALVAGGALAALGGCSADSGIEEVTYAEPEGDLAIDMSAWNYDSDNDVYWQVGLAYCTAPQLMDYETMGLYVPGAHFTGTANDDGETYTCELAEDGSVGDFTAETAPIVIPVNTAGYAAQAAPTSYSYDSVSAYLEEGFIYAYPGCRGRDNGASDDGSITYAGGAPWGVTDLKAAVRYLRFNSAWLPGNSGAVFTFGHSGGGAQSSLMGATGDSSLYTPYLEQIGAAIEDAEGTAISDAIAGAMCWCPITCLQEADAGYEWQMGQFADSGTRAEGTFTAQLSADLAAAYAERVNEMGLEQDGTSLTLEESDEGVYLSGTYADAVVAAIEESLNNFLSDTEFPYTPSSTTMADGGFGGGLSGGGEGGPSGDIDTSELPDDASGGELPSGDAPDGELPSGDAPDGDAGDASAEGAAASTGAGTLRAVSSTTETTETTEQDEPVDGDLPSDTQGEVTAIDEGELPSGGGPDGTDSTESTDSSTSYETAADYIASLNADEEWVTYDESSNTATITGLGAFARVCKAPTKDVGAFDDLSLSQAENKVFSDGTDEGCHFDAIMADLLAANADTYAELENWDESYPEVYAEGLEKTDSLGLTVADRCDLYNPLYYVLASSEGYGSSIPAPYWRIRTGITQGDTALTTELNLSLALQNCDGVESVDFATVWGQGHTTAERTGDSDSNFIEWVKECL